ncbi:MAG: hypothetical protein IT423_05380 [Pirellulaceae bacterium]|nr:hypothetical protein [Pirellulaceae bacterium]
MAVDRSGELSSEVRQVLSGVRGQIRWRILVDGLLLASLCVLLLFWGGAVIDYLPVKLGSNETPRWLRIALLTAMGGLVAWALLWRLARRYLARLSDRNLAVLLERHFPQLNNELVTVVDLTDKSPDDVSNPVAYRAMLTRVQQSAAMHVSKLDTGLLLNWRPVWKLSWAVGLLLLLTAGVAIAQPGWLRLWSARLFALSDERWPRLARLEIEGVQLQLPAFTGQLAADRVTIPFVDSIVRVPRGGAVTLNARADTSAALVPELCTLFYQMGDGSRGRANMRRLGASSTGWQPFLLDGPPLVDLTSDVMFDIVGGDARLDDLTLQVVDPAVITNMKLELTYPAYLLASQSNLPATELLEFRSGVRIPEGTQVSLKGTASSTLKSVQYVVRSTGSNRNRGQSATAQPPASGANNTDSASADDAAALLAAANKDEIQIQTVQPQDKAFELPLGILRDTLVIEIRLLDQYGLTSDQIPRYVVAVTEDTLPEVEAKLVGIGTAVTPKAILPITGKAVDDHGLARVWATIVVNEQPPVELDVAVDSQGKMDPKIDLVPLAESGQLKLAPDSTLGLAISATDRFDLDGIKHTGNGQPIQLAIVTEDKLLVMLDRQELELRQRLELIISELTQLRDVLREQGGVTQPAAQNMPRNLPRNLPGHLDRHLDRQIRNSFVQEPGPAKPPADQAAATPVAPGTPAATPEPADNDAGDKPDPEQMRRLMLLRAQQSVLQADKSQQELIGVAGRVEEIRLQLVNNRIDSVDRQARLLDRVYKPLNEMLATEMESFRNRLSQFQSAAMSPTGGQSQAATAAEENERVLAALNAIVANMLDLESFNEIIDLVRGILDDEQRLLDETQKKQKQGILDLLK